MNAWADATIQQPPADFSGQHVSGPLFGRPSPLLHASGAFVRPGAYAMLDWSPVPAMHVLPGVRADYARDAESVTVDPRLSVRWDVRPGADRTTLKGGVGVYRQPPQPYQSIAPFGTPGVQAERAIHYGLRVEQALGAHVELSLEGFYKQLGDLVVPTPNLTASGFSYRNAGDGRSYGSELMLRYKGDGRFFGWISYTLSRSERRDGPGQPTHLFQFDQTHSLTALASYQLGRGWEIGGRFRYVTGSPYTPLVGGVADSDAGAYSPIEGAPFSARSSAFNALDVRIEKTWTLGASAKLSAYVDVQNIYDRKNAEGQTYNFDYTRSQALAGLPILPVIGIRGEL
jgi:hypothetical protein